MICSLFYMFSSILLIFMLILFKKSDKKINFIKWTCIDIAIYFSISSLETLLVNLIGLQINLWIMRKS